ncbi:helix-turn-helix domain-containing protein [Methylobacterium oxalidis]|uniref:HTH marR-type domain-containing protein n=1 Tax=Methylobacterium oxalidis TaxID=944322 RepID=A0A512IYN5_9HYPH|nr:helix-turn-helix domain-containing protein [Methylobacterium oxalidis]GEP02824.1 hypothetical protein MOX02_08620 [Methylobacterium oxalidis]GJE33811.1 hypothetical protein LDDCCGHA_4014 [Methylobacterium oxalidis]GLS66776.1 hypothetical protein GCM10007888_51590 [Methylobacterium oxalidis]
MKGTVEIRVGADLQGVADAFLDAWRRGAGGDTTARRILTFESWDALAATLTPARLKLLRGLRAEPASSIQDLARKLDRPYRRVHDDVVALADAGLIERRPDRSLVVVADRIEASVELV